MYITKFDPKNVKQQHSLVECHCSSDLPLIQTAISYLQWLEICTTRTDSILHRCPVEKVHVQLHIMFSALKHDEYILVAIVIASRKCIISIHKIASQQ